jgi:ComF family protein
VKLNNWLINIQDWLLPRLCPACGTLSGAGRDLCFKCESALPAIRHACPRCAEILEVALPHGTECGACQRRPPAFARTIALFHYASPVDYLVRKLKFSHELGIARTLGGRLAARLADETSRPDVIIPIPLHSARLRERGYNQSLEIARPVARRIDIPLDYLSLVRARATAPQAGLELRERRKNLKNAFVVRHPDRVRGKHIALVDDVMTTGSTAQAAARALRTAGAADISIWVIARA